MSSGARQITQIAKETVIGTTPSPFDRQTFEFTTNGLYLKKHPIQLQIAELPAHL